MRYAALTLVVIGSAACIYEAPVLPSPQGEKQPPCTYRVTTTADAWQEKGHTLVFADTPLTDVNLAVEVTSGACTGQWWFGPELACGPARPACITSELWADVLTVARGSGFSPVQTLPVEVKLRRPDGTYAEIQPWALTFVPTPRSRSLFAGPEGIGSGEAPNDPASWPAVVTMAQTAVGPATLGLYLQRGEYDGVPSLDVARALYIAGGLDEHWTYTPCGCGGAASVRWNGGPELNPGLSAILDRCSEQRARITMAPASTTPAVRFALATGQGPTGLQGLRLMATSGTELLRLEPGTRSSPADTVPVILADSDLVVAERPQIAVMLVPAVGVTEPVAVSLHMSATFAATWLEVPTTAEDLDTVSLRAPVSLDSEIIASCLAVHGTGRAAALWTEYTGGSVAVRDSGLMVQGSGDMTAAAGYGPGGIVIERSRLLAASPSAAQAAGYSAFGPVTVIDSELHAGFELAGTGFIRGLQDQLADSFVARGNLICLHGAGAQAWGIALDGNGTAGPTYEITDNVINGPPCADPATPTYSTVGISLSGLQDVTVRGNWIEPAGLSSTTPAAIDNPSVSCTNVTLESNAIVAWIRAVGGSFDHTTLAFNTVLYVGVSSQTYPPGSLPDLWGLSTTPSALANQIHDNLFVLANAALTALPTQSDPQFQSNTILVATPDSAAHEAWGNSYVPADPGSVLCDPSWSAFNPHLRQEATVEGLGSASGVDPPDIDGDARAVDGFRGADAAPVTPACPPRPSSPLPPP